MDTQVALRGDGGVSYCSERRAHIRSHTRVAGNEVADHLAKLARDTALRGDGVPVLRAAKDEYSRLTDAHHGVTHDNDLAS